MTKKEIDARYYRKHRQECLQRARDYYFANKEDISHRKSEWYQKRRELIKERSLKC